jgi:hypothetical protein
MTGTFLNATRVMNGLTARAEKRLLIWLAHRLPAAIHSDHLTTLAAVAMVGDRQHRRAAIARRRYSR